MSRWPGSLRSRAVASADPQSFDDLAALYDGLHDLRGDDGFASWLGDRLPTHGGSALDLGCGAGRHTVVLADRCATVVAVDLSGPMVARARALRARGNVDYQQRDLLDVAGTFDVVFSRTTLHHVVDLRRALEHIRGLVAPGGRAVLVDNVCPASLSWGMRTLPAPIVRSYFRGLAHAGLLADVARRRPAAGRTWRLAADCRWVAHLAADRWLTPRRFDEVYGSVFPGAVTEDLGGFRACRWTAPGRPA